MLKFFITTCITGAVFFAAPVFAQNMNSADARLDRIEREMQTLSRSVFRGDVPPPPISGGGGMESSQAAAMETRFNQIEDQLRRLTNTIEETNFRVRQMESSAQAAPAVTSQSQMGISTPNNSEFVNDSGSTWTVDNQPYQLGTINTATEATTPAGLYDQAFSFLQTNDYASAQATFDDFLVKYPDHSLAANAKYWLGETFYERQDYESASRAFARSFKDHPDGQKAPDTLLKLAMSLKGQGMNPEACLTLKELDSRFPDAPSSVTSKAADEKSAYACDW